MKNLTNAAHLEEFARYIEQYQTVLNLQDWRIEHSGKPAAKGCMAQMGISYCDKLAVWSFGKDFGAMPVTPKTLKATAIHELLHVFLRPLIEAAVSRDEDALEAAEHSVVVVLEKLLAKD